MLRLKKYFLITLVVLFIVSCGGQDNENSKEEDSVSTERGKGGLIATDEMLVAIPIAEPPASSYGDDTLPKSHDLSLRMPPVRHQGKQGSCASWAVGYYLKSYHEHLDKGIDYGTGDDYSGVYSPAFLYNSVKVGSCSKGSYIYKNLERVRTIGISTWKDMPYDPNSCDTLPSPKVTKEANCAKILDYRKLDIASPISDIGLQDMKSYLSLDNPLVIGIRVYDGFENPKKFEGEFFYKEYNPKNKKGQHVVVVVGYDDDKNAFKVINSWGKEWGNDGFLWIDYKVFSQIVYVAYETEDAEDECEEGSSFLSVDKQSLLFNTKTINSSYTKSFILSNSGSRAFEIEDITTPYGYSLNWKKGTIQAGESKTIMVTFYPTEEKAYNGKIIIKHDADQGNGTLTLIGAGKSKAKENLPPKADAGEDITVEEGKNIIFDASKSSDNDGRIVQYEWKLGDTLLSESKTFEKDDLWAGLHRVTLKVTDDKGLSNTDTIIITVNKKDNFAPIAKAGDNISVNFGESVIFDASNSTDSDGDIIAYEWREGDTLLSRSSSFSKNNFTKGEHTVILKVTDNKGATDKDIIIITVIKKRNSIPTANAGEDMTITVGDSIKFDASKSSDDGKIVKYEWTYLDDKKITHYSPTITYNYLGGLFVGTHIFTLTVTDDEGQTDTDIMTLTVLASDKNLKPNIRLSYYENDKYMYYYSYKTIDNKSVRFFSVRPNTEVKLDAEYSRDYDGEIVSYEWKEGNQVLGNESTLIKKFSIGEHSIILTIKDNDGEIDTQAIIINVGRVDNILPIANAGEDQTMVLGGKIDLDASKSRDSDGEIISYKWNYNEWHSRSSSSPELSFTPSIDAIGTYIFTLTVRDNDGSTATDTITVTVIDK